MISYCEEKRLFKLDTKNSSYVIAVNDGILYHLYWGKRFSSVKRTFVQSIPYKGIGFSALDVGITSMRSSDLMPIEYPTFGSPDLRSPALHIRYANGSTATSLRYVSHIITKGKPKLEGLPATYTEDGDDVETLSITLYDEFSKLIVTLNYSVWYEYDAIARSAVIHNVSDEEFSILTANSVSFDMVDAANYDMLNLYGVWGRERNIERMPLRHGIQMVDSKRGASSANQNPFIALMSKNCDENIGEAYGISLLYSGNFAAGVELDGHNTARVFMGVNPFDFGYKLMPNEIFTTPEAVMVYSDSGLGGMSRSYHSLYRSRLCRGKYRDIERPVLINNWEATYYDFNEDKLVEIAKTAKEIGVELFVLDDGWFGERESEKDWLGDWTVNKKKLPNGISALADRINALGMKFGLWFEPEMVSPNSDLFRAHPDWYLHIEGRPSCLGRSQYILDLSREDVCEYLINTLSNVLDSANIEYVKWDMNRNMTEIGSVLLPPERQSEVSFRYMLGLYRVLETITSKYPNVLLESCSGGGGRFDPGMLYYSPQIWTSDTTDAVERLKLQYGTSIVYPFSTMGSHISAVPNHQMGRTTPFSMRSNVAVMGQFGFELDVNTLTPEEIEQAKESVKFYKEYGSIMHTGECYRICSPFDSDMSVIEFISSDKNTVLVNICSKIARANAPFKRFVLKNLEDDAIYVEKKSGIEVTGGELCSIGIPFINGKEYNSEILVFNKK